MAKTTFKPLDELMIASGLKYNSIAQNMNISKNGLYKMRQNPLSMTIEQMEQLANILGVSFSDIYRVRKKFRCEVDKNTTR